MACCSACLVLPRKQPCLACKPEPIREAARAGRPEPVVELRAPKALLQQHCQRAGWPPPRFERCAAGGLRLPAAGVRYAVTLEVPASGGGRRRGGAQARAFALREEDDGWEAIQDAQNAAATLALHAVRLGDAFSVHFLLFCSSALDSL
jgi:hypothetical protein